MREPKLIVLETYQLYSRLISCTRKIRTLHLESKCVFVSARVSVCVRCVKCCPMKRDTRVMGSCEGNHFAMLKFSPRQCGSVFC